MRSLVKAITAVLMLGLAIPAAAQSAVEAAMDAANAAAAEPESPMSSGFEEFVPKLSDDCKAGTLDACWRLGLYYKGQYDLADKARAQFLASCAKKEPRSCYMLAGMANQGDGGTRDEGQARVAYGKACELGLAFACSSQAGMMASGDGGKEDKPGAAKAYARGCELGSASACADAAALHANDSEAPYHDNAKARALYTRSCDLGMASSCSSLAGLMYDYSSGEISSADRVTSQKLYQKACMSGDSYACDTWLTAQLDAP